MIIVRDGIAIELTKEELFDAYLEQQTLFDMRDIELNMKSYLNEDEYEILQNNEDFIENTADELRKNRDEYDMDFETAIETAFEEVKSRYLN